MAEYNLEDDQLAGNEADSHNIYDEKYKQNFGDVKKSEEEAAKAGGESSEENKGSSGDENTSEDGADADKDNVVNREQTPKKPKEDDDDDPVKNTGKKSKFKGSGSTIIGGGIVVFIGGILISMATGSSFWAALEKQLTNDGDDAGRTNSLMHRAYNNFITNAAGCGDKKVTLKCKMKTLTKKGADKIKAGTAKIKGLIFKSDGSSRGSPGEEIKSADIEEGDRVNIQEVELEDGKTVSSAPDLNNHLDVDIEARSRFSRIIDPIKSSFLMKAYSKKISAKFGVSKKGATAEEKNIKEGTSDEDLKKAASDMESKTSGVNKKLGKIVKAAMFGSVSSTVTDGVVTACTIYNAAKGAVATVKAYWAIDLIRFMYPFFRLISKIADGSATDADYNEIQAKFMQLTDYMPAERGKELKNKITTNSLTDEDKDYLKKYGINLRHTPAEQQQEIDEVVNKNAFDAQAIRTAMFGDMSTLGSIAKQFAIGGIGATALTTDAILGSVQGMAGFGSKGDGKKNIKSLCKTARSISNMQTAEGLGEQGVALAACLTTGAGCVGLIGKTIWNVGKSLVVSAAIGAAISILAKKIVDSNIDLSLDMRGPAAGNAIASGLALMLARKSQGSALKPSMSTVSTKGFITSTQDNYNKYGDEIARYDARSEPFNIYNRYSFLGTLMSKLVPSPVASTAQISGFSILSNLFSVSTSVFGNSVSALHSSPSLLTINDKVLNSRTNNGDCEVDADKQDTGMICDRTTGRAIMISSPRVLRWAEQDASGKTDHLSEAIDWMSKDQNADESHVAGGTRDETCTWLSSMGDMEIGITDILSTPDKIEEAWKKCGESSQKSIDEDGKVNEKSQFAKYIKYCTDERETEMGSSNEDLDKGSDKDQWWADGSQCALTYDKLGNPSTSDKFNPQLDTGEGSLMMDYFNYYYNMCYVQYAMMNDATDCTNDADPNESGGGSSGIGNKSLVDAGREMATWGAKYNACYIYGAGHGKDTEWFKKALENHFSGDYAVDCSAWVRGAILYATGNDPGDMTTMSMCDSPDMFERIPRDQAQPGDFVMSCTTHVEMILDVNGGDFKTVGSHSDGCGAGKGSSDGTYQGTENFVLRYKG